MEVDFGFDCENHSDYYGNVYVIDGKQKNLCDNCIEIFITIGRIDYE